MRDIERIVDLTFQQQGDGSFVFRPFGRLATGYVVDSDPRKEALRSFARRWVLATLGLPVGWYLAVLLGDWLARAVVVPHATFAAVVAALFFPTLVLLLAYGAWFDQKFAAATRGLKVIPPSWVLAPRVHSIASRTSRGALALHGVAGAGLTALGLGYLLSRYLSLERVTTVVAGGLAVIGLTYYLCSRLLSFAKRSGRARR